MCGIVAVLRRRCRQPVAPPEVVLDLLESALAAVADTARLDEAASSVARADVLLRGPRGVRMLLGAPAAVRQIEGRLADLDRAVAIVEGGLDAGDRRLSASELETVNAALVRLRDSLWAIRHDRLRAADGVAELAGPGATASAVEAFWSIQVALSAVDRLEVRGRDSAGVHVLVTGHGLDLADPTVARLIQARADDPLFLSGSVRAASGCLAFVYKAAAEIGELGDNTRRLREAIRADGLLRRALAADTATATVLGHTRWASVGIVSEVNAHPLNHEEDGGGRGPYVAAALNGDVDNYAALKLREGLRVPAEVTTDAKVIPVLVSRRLAGGLAPADAFLDTARALDGSVAVVAVGADAPDQLFLALRGSGQALYVGLADDAYVVASEPYGLVEETAEYVRMDGESGAVPGQVVVLDAAGAGTLDGIERRSYDGTALPVAAGDVRTAEITTRDVDRAGYPHYLLKEISQAAGSVRKTLRGRLVRNNGPGRWAVALGEETLPAALRRRLRDGSIRRLVAIGQGTAGVAAQSLATALGPLVDRSRLQVDATLATELSGFGLADDMRDTLVVAVSQSGTTTDTNRTVDLVRARGAAVIGIVNRRNSDLVERVEGVLYTSDGRDVEMAVPSTKAFYAQVAAGVLLAVAIAGEVHAGHNGAGHNGHTRAVDGLLDGLRSLPDAMDEVLARRPEIAAAAQRHAPSRRYWAVVGNGANRIAAQELRIKLSELCYKSIAFDLTEDKKHVDLSSEPLILVCAAGLSGTNAGDVGKEVAIYRAHRAAAIVIADEGASEFDAALETLAVPPVEPAVAFVLAAMAGHLFGYEAALAIDAQARPLREVRAAVETVVGQGDGLALLDGLGSLGPLVARPAGQFLNDLQAGRYDGHLEASTALRIATVLRHAVSPGGLEGYEAETGRVATPNAFLNDLTDALTRGIGELTRPVDAIKHQAKTVTVGISRSEEALYGNRLVQAVLGAGAPRDRLGYRSLRTLLALDPAVVNVTGWTRYAVDGHVGDDATIRVVDRGGVAVSIPTRTERDPTLRGSKHRSASLREVLVARGGADGRTVVIVPEAKEGEIGGLTLLHADFHDRLEAEAARAVLLGYLDRYDALVDQVTEHEPAFDPSVLARIPIVDLLTEPVRVLAEAWHRQ